MTVLARHTSPDNPAAAGRRGRARVALVASYAPSLVNFRGHLIRTLVERGYEVAALAPRIDERTTAWLEALGVRAVSVRLNATGLNPVEDLLTVWRLARVFRGLRPDVVLSYTVKPVIYGSIAATVAGVPRVCSLITGLGYAFSGDSFRHWATRTALLPLYSLSLRFNRVVIVQNPDDLAFLSGRDIVPRTARVARVNGSGVDLDYYYPAPPVTEPVVFLLIARLLREKGIREYAEAAGRLKERYPEAQFRLVGWLFPNPGAISQDELESWTARGWIVYRGRVEDVRPEIAAASVYVLPSYREGMPRTVLEAMSMARPVITTDAPGCRETVVDGANGFLVPPRDPEALAEAMERFIRDRSLIPQMGQASRRLAEQRFDVRKVTEEIIRALGLDA